AGTSDSYSSCSSSNLPVDTSHNFNACELFPPVTNSLLSGEKANRCTSSLRLVSVCRFSPVRVSQNRTFPSKPPSAKILSSGDRATDRKLYSQPFNFFNVLPVDTSIRVTQPPRPAVATASFCPSTEKASPILRQSLPSFAFKLQIDLPDS